MRTVFRVSVSWPNGIRETGAPDFDQYESAQFWIESWMDNHTSANVDFEIRKVFVK